MNVLLMHPNQDLDMQPGFLPHEREMIRDLGIEVIVQAMSGEDKFIHQIVERTLLSSLDNVQTITYRQAVLRDAIDHAAFVRDLYALVTDTLEQRKRIGFYGIFRRHPSAVLRESIELMQFLVERLRMVRVQTDEARPTLHSEGLQALADRLNRELSDEYLGKLQDHLHILQFRRGLLMSASLDWTLKGVRYTLHKPPEPLRHWPVRLFEPKSRAFTFHIADRDEAGFRALEELEDRGVRDVANALTQSIDHVLGFFSQLRTDLAFYVGSLNLYDALTKAGHVISWPEPLDDHRPHLTARNLRDVGMLLGQQTPVVGNDINADNKLLIVITGANQGGKSTFLRSLGLAQLMMQSGLFVAAQEFCANVASGIYTHFKREEDAGMQSGKFDEELSRLSQMIDYMKPASMLCLNESFASTDEREGSEVSGEIVRALIESGVKVLFVTHLHAFAQEWYETQREDALFLRAQRLSDGSRSFKVVEGSPLETSFGIDLYHEIFAASSVP